MSAVESGVCSVPTKLRAARLVLVIFLLEEISGYPSATGTEKPTLRNETRPFFDDVSRREIEATEGQTLVIPCTVRNLYKDKVVSWIRTRDLHILTSGRHTFSSDFRFEALHTDSSGDFWGLRIRGVRQSDSGQYECQVNTDPKMSLAVKLSVSVPGTLDSADLSKWLGKAEIAGPKEVFVQYGSTFFLQCKVHPILDQSFILGQQANRRPDVWWLHEDTQISVEAQIGKIFIETTYNEEDEVINSRLHFFHVSWQDEGAYTCMRPSVKRDSVRIIVVEAEPSEAMQRDYPISSTSVNRCACTMMKIFPLLLGSISLRYY
ncbi:uncharacterized protein LOC132702420 [Cylas formicarius]|uniref:uncharacterized protein LOC132702420 n=1 Tax=Cylas formicarius TaxID=197179 RepID=UPI0029586E62|nr:uncharacterized protein LOC132702420 [Cylas formicarius]